MDEFMANREEPLPLGAAAAISVRVMLPTLPLPEIRNLRRSVLASRRRSKLSQQKTRSTRTDPPWHPLETAARLVRSLCIGRGPTRSFSETRLRFPPAQEGAGGCA